MAGSRLNELHCSSSIVDCFRDLLLVLICVVCADGAKFLAAYSCSILPELIPRVGEQLAEVCRAQ